MYQLIENEEAEKQAQASKKEKAKKKKAREKERKEKDKEKEKEISNDSKRGPSPVWGLKLRVYAALSYEWMRP